MGKIRTKIIGLEDVEKEQKAKAKLRSDEKKMKKAKELKTDEEIKSVPAAEKSEVKQEKEKDKKPKKTEKETKKTVVEKERGKKYKEVKKLVDKTKSYLVEEAVVLLKKMKTAKFDESVEIHFNVDETGLKGEVELPYSTGKIVKVAVVSDAVLIDIEKGKINFDILVTHPSFMPKLAKFAKILGPRGLMPNPKAGTISTTPEDVVKKFSKGLLRWKTEAKFPLIHQMIGKLSLEEKSLVENAKKIISSVGKTHIQKAYLKSTMSPSIRIDIERE